MHVLIFFVNEYLEFRLPEFLSCCQIFDYQIPSHKQILETNDLFIELENVDPVNELPKLKQVCQRCILVRGCYELLAKGTKLQDLAAQVFEKGKLWRPYDVQQKPYWKLLLESFGRKVNNEEKVTKFKTFFSQIEQLQQHQFDILETIFAKKELNLDRSLAEQGVVREFSLIEYYGNPNLLNKKEKNEEQHQYTSSIEQLGIPSVQLPSGLGPLTEPILLYFTYKLCDGNRLILNTYDLAQRDYIDTTTMKAPLSFLTANQALVTSNSLVLDPFCGTGSILISCAHFHSKVLGSDIDMRVLHGVKKQNKTIFSNFDQYHLRQHCAVDFLRVDMSTPPWRFENTLDAIVSDPPYGVREGAKRIGRAEEKEIPEQYLQTHIPASVRYDFQEMMQDLLNFAAKTLKKGGRLVYWLPTTLEFNPNTDIPTHPQLEFIVQSCDYYSAKRHRRLITMQKK